MTANDDAALWLGILAVVYGPNSSRLSGLTGHVWAAQAPIETPHFLSLVLPVPPPQEHAAPARVSWHETSPGRLSSITEAANTQRLRGRSAKIEQSVIIYSS